MVILPSGKKLHFGQVGYQDYTIHKDPKRRELYVKRHAGKEDWTKRGIETKGWWAYWVLWNEPDLMEAIERIQKLFKIQINFIN